MTTSLHPSSLPVIALLVLPFQAVVQGFVIPFNSRQGRYPTLCFSEPPAEQAEENVSYFRRFARGDYTRMVITTATDQVNQITGQDEWHAGDLARWLDERAKERLNKVKEDDDGEYQYNYGDFTRWATNLALEQAAVYAGKESASDYKVGDISRTIIAKVKSGEYETKDVFLALRILLAAGFSIVPVVNVLPMQWLLSLVTVGLTKNITGRVSEKLLAKLTESLEDRIEGALSDKVDSVKANTKAKWNGLVSKFVGKDKYVKGDLARAIRATADEAEPQQMEDLKQIVDSLEGWDDTYLKQDDVVAP